MNRTSKNIVFFVFVLFCAAGIGAMIFAISNRWIILNFPQLGQSKTAVLVPNHATHTKKNITIHLPKKKNKTEEVAILISEKPEVNAHTISTAWLAKINEEGLLEKETTIQSATLTKDQQQLLISFDRPPFNKQASIENKLAFLESLCKTLATHIPTLRSVLWLVHHKPLIDYHFDCSIAWPITGFPELKKPLENHIPAPTLANKPHITIMLDPAGDAGNKGRLIEGTFERGITLQYAEKLKQELSKESGYRVVLTRFPGESIEPLQNATFSNRLQADLFISLNFFHTTHEPAAWYLYYYTTHPTTDHWYKAPSRWDSIHTIYHRHLPTTTSYITKLHQNLHKQLQSTCALYAPRGIPLRPLVGLAMPAIAIEIGLPPGTSFEHLVDPLAEAIKNTIVKLTKDGTTNT